MRLDFFFVNLLLYLVFLMGHQLAVHLPEQPGVFVHLLHDLVAQVGVALTVADVQRLTFDRELGGFASFLDTDF